MKIKICGITNLPDAQHVIDCGVDMIGFIFYKESPRYISPQDAKDIIKKLPSEFNTVGVFVNDNNKSMCEIAEFCGIKTLQFHGHEKVEQLNEITSFDVVKALTVITEDDLKKVSVFAEYPVLIDSRSDTFGGSGKCADWKLASSAASIGKVILAGGLTPENVVNAVNIVKPFAVDVSSGVEKSKRYKDHTKIRVFIDNIRSIENC